MFPPLIYVFHSLSDTFSHIVLKLPINNKKIKHRDQVPLTLYALISDG